MEVLPDKTVSLLCPFLIAWSVGDNLILKPGLKTSPNFPRLFII